MDRSRYDFSGELSPRTGARVARAPGRFGDPWRTEGAPKVTIEGSGVLIDGELLLIDWTLGKVEKFAGSIDGKLLPFDGMPGQIENVQLAIDGSAGKIEEIEGSIDGEVLPFDGTSREIENVECSIDGELLPIADQLRQMCVAASRGDASGPGGARGGAASTLAGSSRYARKGFTICPMCHPSA